MPIPSYVRTEVFVLREAAVLAHPRASAIADVSLDTGGHLSLIDGPAVRFLTQVLRYKVGAIPPIETAEQVKAEEALTHPEEAAAAPAET